MKTFLFVHQNYPGQFLHLAPELVRRGHLVYALACASKVEEASWSMVGGVKLFRFSPKHRNGENLHPWVGDWESKVIRGEAVLKVAIDLKEREGLNPDVIFAHPGWGEALFLKSVWPDSKLVLYGEFYYDYESGETNFDKEFQASGHPSIEKSRLLCRNINQMMSFESADFGVSPTHWQASTYPEAIRKKLKVIHDGIDTDSIKPNPNVYLNITTKSGKKIRVDRDSEVITFVNRNLEPYRGFHVFMRALPALLRLRPKARFVVVGANGVSYGRLPEGGKSWKEVMIAEVGGQISTEDWDRVHFVGKVDRKTFTQMLQVSSVHLYLTYPFVLSWSLLEAMSAGCAVVASSTQPVNEVIQDGQNGLLFDFFDGAQMAEKICEALDKKQIRQRITHGARQTAVEKYDLTTVSLPRLVQLLDE